jgi:hypothetical protein
MASITPARMRRSIVGPGSSAPCNCAWSDMASLPLGSTQRPCARSPARRTETPHGPSCQRLRGSINTRVGCSFRTSASAIQAPPDRWIADGGAGDAIAAVSREFPVVHQSVQHRGCNRMMEVSRPRQAGSYAFIGSTQFSQGAGQRRSHDRRNEGALRPFVCAQHQHRQALSLQPRSST